MPDTWHTQPAYTLCFDESVPCTTEQTCSDREMRHQTSDITVNLLCRDLMHEHSFPWHAITVIHATRCHKETGLKTMEYGPYTASSDLILIRKHIVELSAGLNERLTNLMIMQLSIMRIVTVALPLFVPCTLVVTQACSNCQLNSMQHIACYYLCNQKSLQITSITDGCRAASGFRSSRCN